MLPQTKLDRLSLPNLDVSEKFGKAVIKQDNLALFRKLIAVILGRGILMSRALELQKSSNKSNLKGSGAS